MVAIDAANVQTPRATCAFGSLPALASEKLHTEQPVNKAEYKQSVPESAEKIDIHSS